MVGIIKQKEKNIQWNVQLLGITRHTFLLYRHVHILTEVFVWNSITVISVLIYSNL